MSTESAARTLASSRGCGRAVYSPRRSSITSSIGSCPRDNGQRGCRITDLDYADDIAVLSDDVLNLQRAVDEIARLAQSVGLLISPTKTKCFAVPTGSPCVVTLNGGTIEQVEQFRYLRCLFATRIECGSASQLRCQFHNGHHSEVPQATMAWAPAAQASRRNSLADPVRSAWSWLAATKRRTAEDVARPCEVRCRGDQWTGGWNEHWLSILKDMATNRTTWRATICDEVGAGLDGNV